MTDIIFDFVANDIIISNGDFEMINTCGLQNAALIFNKSAASILSPNIGVGFEEIFPNLPQYTWGNIETMGERQVKEDGAIVCSIKIKKSEDGITSYAEIIARYKE